MFLWILLKHEKFSSKIVIPHGRSLEKWLKDKIFPTQTISLLKAQKISPIKVCSISFLSSCYIPQYEVQERTQQFLAIEDVSEMRQRTATDLVQTLVEKIADISEVFEENSHTKLPPVSSGLLCLTLAAS